MYKLIISPATFRDMRCIIFTEDGHFTSGLHVNGFAEYPNYEILFDSFVDAEAFKQLARIVNNIVHN